MLMLHFHAFRAGMGTTMMRTNQKRGRPRAAPGRRRVAHAAGLGKLTVNSALGQTLNAEIDLVSLQPGELDVADRPRGAAGGLPRRPHRILRRRCACCASRSRSAPTASPISRSPASAPINEPFVDVLIEVTLARRAASSANTRSFSIRRATRQAKAAPPTVAAAPAAAPRQPAGHRAGVVFCAAAPHRHGAAPGAPPSASGRFALRRSRSCRVASGAARRKRRRHVRPGAEGRHAPQDRRAR